VEFGDAGKSMLITQDTEPHQVINHMVKAFQIKENSKFFHLLVKRFQVAGSKRVLLLERVLDEYERPWEIIANWQQTKHEGIFILEKSENELMDDVVRSELIKSGWLKRKTLLSWKWQYLIIKKQENRYIIEYYNDEGSKQRESIPKGVLIFIPLWKIGIAENRPLHFELNVGPKLFDFSCNTEEEAYEWVNSISDIMEKNLHSEPPYGSFILDTNSTME